MAFRRTLMRLLVSALLVAGAFSQHTAVCDGPTQVFGSVGATGYSLQTPVGTKGLVTNDVAITGGFNNEDVIQLSVVIAPAQKTAATRTKPATYCSSVSTVGGVTSGGANPGAANIKLGLYTQDTTTTPVTYRLVEQTKNIPVSAADVAGGITITAPVILPAFTAPAATYYVGFATDNTKVCLYGNSNPGHAVDPSDPTFVYSTATPTTSALPTDFPQPPKNQNEFQAGLAVCPVADVHGDPIFRGFHGQLFSVKGEAGKVFNLLSSNDFSFNTRFVSITEQSESMTSVQMREVRNKYKHAKLLDLVASATEDAKRPPVTTAWSHAGTYMGECGLRMGESELLVKPGTYENGFATVTLNGVAVPISTTPIELEGEMTITRPSAFKLQIATRDIRFNIVNSDRFVNIEHAAVVNNNAQLSGLLGQTMDSEWEVVQSAEFKQHLENDFKLASNNLFGADFEGQQF